VQVARWEQLNMQPPLVQNWVIKPTLPLFSGDNKELHSTLTDLRSSKGHLAVNPAVLFIKKRS
jgi:hypothetical protein